MDVSAGIRMGIGHAEHGMYGHKIIIDVMEDLLTLELKDLLFRRHM
jgi:hypothetical protein